MAPRRTRMKAASRIRYIPNCMPESTAAGLDVETFKHLHLYAFLRLLPSEENGRWTGGRVLASYEARDGAHVVGLASVYLLGVLCRVFGCAKTGFLKMAFLFGDFFAKKCLCFSVRRLLIRISRDICLSIFNICEKLMAFECRSVYWLRGDLAFFFFSFSPSRYQARPQEPSKFSKIKN